MKTVEVTKADVSAFFNHKWVYAVGSALLLSIIMWAWNENHLDMEANEDNRAQQAVNETLTSAVQQNTQSYALAEVRRISRDIARVNANKEISAEDRAERLAELHILLDAQTDILDAADGL